MSAPAVPRPAPRPSPVVPTAPRPVRRAITCAEFHAFSDLGVFEGENVFLIDGEILQMPAPGPLHDVATALVEAVLRAVFGPGWWVRGQMSLVLGLAKDPVPDVAVVAGAVRSFAARKPTTAALVIEVSDSSLAYDQTDKASLYAAAGIAEYWIVDLVNRVLEVRRSPRPDASQPFGHAYADVRVLKAGDAVSPLARPSASVAVADLLP